MMRREGYGVFIPDIFSHSFSYRRQINLDGRWQFRRDPDGKGEEVGWHEGRTRFSDRMTVPGAPQAQGFGEPELRQKTYFSDPFWIRRTFDLPEMGMTNRVWLRIGGIQPAARIYINGIYLGYTKSSRTPQRADVTDLVRSGRNLIAIMVCDLPDVRLDGIYEMPGLTVTWTGPYGPIACEITDTPSIIDAYVRPDIQSKSIRVDVDLSASTQETVVLALAVKDGEDLLGGGELEVPRGKDHARARVDVENFVTWSPDHPKLYMLEISLRRHGGGRPFDKVGLRFGMREIAAKGTKFHLNGKPILMRFFGDDHLYPDTLCPPANKNWYLPRLKLAREYGMNGVKSCVETIPPAYIEAADEAGIMIIQEMPFGLSGLRENRHTIDEAFRGFYLTELDGLVRTSRNHASVISYSMSSEMEFDKQTQESFDFFNRELVLHAKRLAPHALFVDCTGYSAPNAEDTSKGKRRTDYYASLVTTRKDVLDEPSIESDGLRPLVLHEYYWWSCYPELADRERYEGTQMNPFWLDILEKTARENAQENLLPTYRKNSLWLQALCRKDGIEYVRRSPNIEGYILWLLIDLGQWSEGLLNDFWEPKNVSAKEFLRSNGDTVVVLGTEGNRCYPTGDKVRIPLAIDHYGECVLRGCTILWRAKDGITVQSGEIEVPDIELGEFVVVGAAEVGLPRGEEAYRFQLDVVLQCREGVINTNAWSFWAFPDPGGVDRAGTKDGVFSRLGKARGGPIPENVSIVLADSVDEDLATYVETGGRCLLFTSGAVIENSAGDPGPRNLYRFFRTIPWNLGNYGNSGTVITDHPALAAFPHDGRCDLQFISMLKDRIPMDFSPLLRHRVGPIIRVIDHYIANRNNAHMIEFTVGRGKVLVTSLGVLECVEERIEARFLLHSLLGYVGGPDFSPEAVVPKEEFLKLFGPRSE